MKSKIILSSVAVAFMAVLALGTPVWAATGVQVGASGKTYANGIQCALHPVKGFSPLVMAGLYNPKATATATVSKIYNFVESVVASVNFVSPDAQVWLENGVNTVVVALNKRTADSYTFDASLLYFDQPNMCIPDTRSNIISGDLETAASGKSAATVAPGCAMNGATGRAQPYVNLFDNGTYLLNVSVNNVPLTQLSSRRLHTPVFLSPGLNVISAANGSLSTDYYVRNGGDGTCVLP